MTTIVGVYKKSSRFSAKSHVDVLGTVIKITLAVDERSAFGPGTFSTLKLCSHLTARKAIQYDTNNHRYVIGAEQLHRGTQRQFSENICSEEDLRPRIFGTFIVNFLACLPLLGFSNI